MTYITANLKSEDNIMDGNSFNFYVTRGTLKWSDEALKLVGLHKTFYEEHVNICIFETHETFALPHATDYPRRNSLKT